MISLKRMMLVVFGVALLLNVISADSGIGAVSAALYQLCSGVKSLLPIASMLMIVLAGVIYAGGQMMGAETRARANVWATACLTGAVIGLLIVVIAPSVLGVLYNNGTSGDIATC